MTSYNARVKKSFAEQSTLQKKPEHCSAYLDKLATIGRTIGHQIRIKRNQNQALFTVSKPWQEQPDNILRMIETARSRLGTTEEFDAEIASVYRSKN